MFDKITITDIAKRVGVSKATVSYYLNGNFQKMSFQTREDIRRAIEETGYKPSNIAKGLATKDTRTIGVVIADITNPFISSVMKGISDICKSYGYTVNFTNSDNDLQTELDNLNRLSQESVSGIILDSVDANHSAIQGFDNQKMVMLDRQSSQLVVDTVVSDNLLSTQKFIEKIQEAGYKDIYFVSFPIEGISTRELRYKGYQLAMQENDLMDKVLILGRDRVKERFLDIIANSASKPAFFTMNGPVLLQFMKMIGETDYSYPKDFGLGSYEDLDWMSVLQPSISCIRQDSYRIGQTAARRLISKLQSETYFGNPEILTVTNSIIIRESF